MLHSVAFSGMHTVVIWNGKTKLIRGNKHEMFCILYTVTEYVHLACFRGPVWCLHASRNSERWSGDHNTRHCLVSMYNVLVVTVMMIL